MLIFFSPAFLSLIVVVKSDKIMLKGLVISDVSIQPQCVKPLPMIKKNAVPWVSLGKCRQVSHFHNSHFS